MILSQGIAKFRPTYIQFDSLFVRDNPFDRASDKFVNLCGRDRIPLARPFACRSHQLLSKRRGVRCQAQSIHDLVIGLQSGSQSRQNQSFDLAGGQPSDRT